MAAKLDGKKVAMLVEQGFEEVEMTEPRKALEKAGAGVDLVSPRAGGVRSAVHAEPGRDFPVDVVLAEASPDDYDALVLPGGVVSPDHLRINQDAVQFVRAFFEAGKPVAAICHGPWTLINAGVVRGRRMTSWPSVSLDLTNAGAKWTDEAVVVDRGLVTSRKPEDIPAFNAKMIEEFAEGIHEAQRAAAAESWRAAGTSAQA